MSLITIKLSKKELDTSSPGYDFHIIYSKYVGECASVFLPLFIVLFIFRYHVDIVSAKINLCHLYLHFYMFSQNYKRIPTCVSIEGSTFNYRGLSSKPKTLSPSLEKPGIDLPDL